MNIILAALRDNWLTLSPSFVALLSSCPAATVLLWALHAARCSSLFCYWRAVTSNRTQARVLNHLVPSDSALWTVVELSTRRNFYTRSSTRRSRPTGNVVSVQCAARCSLRHRSRRIQHRSRWSRDGTWRPITRRWTGLRASEHHKSSRPSTDERHQGIHILTAAT